jgi:tetratricopeptide (TPR) repeat protein
MVYFRLKPRQSLRNRDAMNFSRAMSSSGWQGWFLAACLLGTTLPLSVSIVAQSTLNPLLEKAREAEKSGDFPGAERIYLQALQLEPENSEVLKRLGVVEQTELKFDKSVLHFKTILSRDRNYFEVNFFLGVSYLGLNDFPEAIQSFQAELRTKNPHPRCHYYLGVAYQSTGKMQESLTQFNQTLANNPNDADALYQLARIYKNASVEAIDRLRALDPDSFQLHVLQAELDSDGERYPEAINEYQAALVKRPDAGGIHFAIGVAYWALHQFAPAKKEFMDALKESPNDPLTNLYLGDIAVRDREFVDGLQYLKVAEQGQADPFRVHLLRAKCYRGQHNLGNAKSEFLTAIQARPNVPEPHYLLAQVDQELNDPAGSEKEFAEFQRLSNLDGEKTPGSSPQN